MALAIMAIVFAAILPQFRSIKNSWDSKQAGAAALQNGRVLIDHFNRNLAQAVRITDVSGSAETNGYIEFKDNDNNSLRYEISDSYVQFGVVGDLSNLAGPVSQLQFTCYDACDLEAAITDCNFIRLVEVETTLTNSAALAQDKTFKSSVYLRTNGNYDPNLVGFWNFNDGTANDSSGNNHHGTIVDGDSGTSIEITYDTGKDSNVLDVNNSAGLVNSVVNFGGGTDWAVIRDQITITCWVTLDTIHTTNQYLLTKGSAYQVTSRATSQEGIRSYMNSLSDEVITTSTTTVDEQWHHIAVTYDPDTSTRILYIDGIRLNTDTPSGRLNTHTDSFVIGGRINPSYNTKGWDGLVDDVRLYSRVLSAEEIAEMVEWNITSGTGHEYDTGTGLMPDLAQIDSTHYLCAYNGPDSDGWAVVLIVDPGDWSVSSGTAFEYDVASSRADLTQLDSTHYLCVYNGPDSDGWAVVLTVDTGDWTITKGTAFEFDTNFATRADLAKIDSTHYLCAYGGVDSDGWAVVLTVDTGDWTISKETPYEFDTDHCYGPDLAEVDSTHWLCIYNNETSAVSRAVILDVNTTDWTISHGTAYDYADCSTQSRPAVREIFSNHYISAYTSSDDDGWVAILAVNTGDWTVSKETLFEYDDSCGELSHLERIDRSHYLCAHEGPDTDGWSAVLSVDITDWSVSKEAAYEYDTSFALAANLEKIDSRHYLCAYGGPDSGGWAVVLNLSTFVDLQDFIGVYP